MSPWLDRIFTSRVVTLCPFVLLAIGIGQTIANVFAPNPVTAVLTCAMVLIALSFPVEE